MLNFLKRKMSTLQSLISPSNLLEDTAECAEEDEDHDLYPGIIWIRGQIDAEKHYEFIEQFQIALFDEEIDEIQIYICSPGGDFEYGVSIFENIRLSSKPVTAVIQGEAASIAAIIALAAKKIIITKNSTMIFHPPFLILSAGYLTKEDNEKNSKRFKKVTKTYFNILTDKLGKTSKLFKSEKYFNAEEALKFGLVDEII